MTPGIGRSVKEGFRAANRSWVGMGVVAGLSVGIALIIVVVAGVSFFMTVSPAELARETPAPEAVAAPAPETPPETQQAAPEATTSETDAAPTDVFNELTTADDVAPPVQDVTAGQAEDTDRLFREWLQRAWPVLLLVALLAVAAFTWLYGGQIGYLAQRVTTQQASLSTFWAAGGRAFGPLVGASLLGLLVFGGGFLVVVLLTGVVASVAGPTPHWALVTVAVLFYLTLFIGWVWLSIRLAFWFISIVVDRLGPLAGLRTSFRATRGRWWKVFWLSGLLGLIGIGVWLPFGLLEAVGNMVGGRAGPFISIISSLLNGVANLYVGFAYTAALIRFYEDTKSAQPNASPAGS